MTMVRKIAQVVLWIVIGGFALFGVLAFLGVLAAADGTTLVQLLTEHREAITPGQEPPPMQFDSLWKWLIEHQVTAAMPISQSQSVRIHSQHVLCATSLSFGPRPRQRRRG